MNFQNSIVSRDWSIALRDDTRERNSSTAWKATCKFKGIDACSRGLYREGNRWRIPWSIVWRRINVLIHRTIGSLRLSRWLAEGIETESTAKTPRLTYRVLYITFNPLMIPLTSFIDVVVPQSGIANANSSSPFFPSLFSPCRLVSFFSFAFPSSSSVEKWNLEKVLSSRVKVATTRYISRRYGA